VSAPDNGVAFPFPESPGEGAIERTRRLLATRPAMRDDMAYRGWLDARDERSSETQRATWAALSEPERQEWHAAAMARLEAYWAMTPAEQREHNAGSLKRTLARNDRAFREMQAASLGTPPTTERTND
jgi:hypothetical protein